MPGGSLTASLNERAQKAWDGCRGTVRPGGLAMARSVVGIIPITGLTKDGICLRSAAICISRRLQSFFYFRLFQLVSV